MRQIIKAIDIQVFFGKGESMSFKMLRNIKKELAKKRHQPITIDEFCKYFDISKEELLPIIQQNDAHKKQKFKKIQPIEEKPILETTQASLQEPIKKKQVPYKFS